MHGTPHDALFKAVFGQPEHARGMLRTIVPAAVGEAIDWRVLTLCPGSFVDAALAHQHSDLLYATRWRGGQEGQDALLYFLFEHQSSPPTGEPMAFRLLRYQLRIWERWWADHPKARKLPAIVPMVLYHGAAQWQEARSFEDLLEVPHGLRPALESYLVRCAYLLHDLSHASEDELRERVWTAVAKLTAVLFQKARSDSDMIALLGRWMNVLREVAAAPNGLDALAQLLRYILEVNEHTTPDELQTLLERELGPGTKETIMTAAQRLREEGRLEAREQELQRGRLLLLRMVQQRFGNQLEPHAEQRLRTATFEQLETWSLRILTAASLAELFAD